MCSEELADTEDLLIHRAIISGGGAGLAAALAAYERPDAMDRTCEPNGFESKMLLKGHSRTIRLRVHNMITMGKMMMEACRARKASNKYLGLTREDCANADPKEWHKWVTLRLDGETIVTGELPLDYYGDLVGNYTAHCGL